MPVNALTHRCDKIENCIVTPIKVCNPVTGAELISTGIWDTGAMGSVITKSKAQQLGLQVVSMTNVRGVHGVKTVPVYQIKLTLNNQNISLTTLVTECDELSDGNQDIAMLIGMNIINMGDFCISNYKGRTLMTFRVPSCETIDYVAEISEFNRCLKVHDIKVQKKIPDKCACGSGKDFKNCHGKSVYNKP